MEISGAGERFFLVLLMAYPPRFRRDYTDGMIDLFRSRLARARAAGPRAWLAFWVFVVADITRTAFAERVEKWGVRRVRPVVSRGARSGPAPPGDPSIDNTSHRRGSLVDSFMQDLRHSVRRLARSPGFTVMAVVIVAVGIGANVAMFSVVDAFLFKPQQWERPDEVVWIFQDSDEGSPNSNSYPAYQDMAGHSDIFTSVAAFIPSSSARYLTDGGDALQVEVTWATAAYLGVIGLRPFRGRWFEALHDNPGSEPVAVVSHRAWQRLFAGASDVVGKRVRLNGQPVTVIGVGPEGYAGAIAGIDNDFWLSISSAGPVGGNFYWRTLDQREDHWFQVLARLRDGVTVRQAQARMDLLAERLATEYPALNEGRDITVFPSARVRVHPDADATLFPVGAVLMAVVGLFLLIACGNLANLTLARASTREKELSVRAALGATRGRLVRALLMESGLLSLAGGAGGVLLAWWAARLLAANQPSLPVPVTLQIAVDLRMLAFAFGLSAVTGMFFGLVPALRASRPELMRGLKDAQDAVASSHTRAGRPRWLGLRNALVVGQLAVSLVLLSGAGLLMRSFVNSLNADLGFTRAAVAVVRADVRESGYDAQTGEQLFEDFKRRVVALPGVEVASFATRLPVTPSGGSSTLEIEGYLSPTGTGEAEVIFAYIEPDYVATLEIPLLHGRNFETTDRDGTERVALVNEAFARRYWGTSDAAGRRYRHQGAPDSWVRIVGVIGDAKVRTAEEAPTPMFYRPLSQSGAWPGRLYLAARTSGDGSETVSAMRRELRALDPEIPVYQAGTMADHVSTGRALPRTAAGMLGAFAVLALMLAGLGLYAVVSFAVSRRTSEIGIRMALGASGGRVVGMVVKEMFGVVAVGMVLGVGLSLLAAPVLESVLFNVTATDPVTLLGVAGVLVLVTLVATWLPARGAVAVDPIEALRAE